MTDENVLSQLAGGASRLLFVSWIDKQFDDHQALDDALFTLVRVDEPLLILRSVSTLRLWGDRIIEAAVSDARDKGATWEEIAGALRRSRQSVHRQYSRGEED